MEGRGKDKIPTSPTSHQSQPSLFISPHPLPNPIVPSLPPSAHFISFHFTSISPLHPFLIPSLTMATTTTTNLRSLHRNANPNLHHHHHSFRRRNLISMNIFSNKLTIASLTNTNTTLSPPNSTSTSTTGTTSLDALSRHLASGDLRQADEETRRLLVALAGEGAARRGYVFFSEVQFVPAEELRAIDRLWRGHSGGRFGYSVQKRVWERRAKRDFTQFFIRVGWMRRLDAAEVEQWNYRSFPDEFTWELKDDSPPEGHLPLTNALRGTQLLASIFAHPAFDEEEEEEEPEESAAAAASNSNLKEEGKERSSLLGGKIKLKPADYSF